MERVRPIIAALVGIGIVVLVIVLLVKAFTGGGGSKPAQQIDLVHYATTTATTELYIDGPIVSEQEHQAVRIVVARDQTEIDIIEGYQNKVTQMQTFPNNSASYANFLQALNRLNFTKGDNSSAQQDERGYCPQGDRYVYRFNTGTSDLFRYWTTSCGQGTFGGKREQVRILFQRQIPTTTFDHLTSRVPLS
jgi:hypothetical protein